MFCEELVPTSEPLCFLMASDPLPGTARSPPGGFMVHPFSSPAKSLQDASSQVHNICAVSLLLQTVDGSAVGFCWLAGWVFSPLSSLMEFVFFGFAHHVELGLMGAAAAGGASHHAAWTCDTRMDTQLLLSVLQFRE